MQISWIGRAACAAFFAAIVLQAQSLEFDVASVKATVDPNVPGRIVHMPGERGYQGVNMPLLAYIRVAYQLRNSQIVAPDWAGSANFDVEAKAAKPSTPDELHVMLQHLLEERFHMKVRRETKEQSGFVLVVDKSGPKLNDHDPEDKVTVPIMPGFGKHTGTNVTMQYLAFYLSNELDKTVVDKTGLGGHYDFVAEWGPDGLPGYNMMPGPPPPNESSASAEMRPMPYVGPTLQSALKEQLGLRLDPAKVPAERLVIDHIEQLTEN